MENKILMIITKHTRLNLNKILFHYEGIIIFKNTKMKKDVSMKNKLEEKERK